MKQKLLDEIKYKSEDIFEYGYVGDYIKLDTLKNILNKYIREDRDIKQPVKLFSVEIMDDCELSTILVVSESKEQAEETVSKMDWSCLIYCVAYEINQVDGYNIILERR